MIERQQVERAIGVDQRCAQPPGEGVELNRSTPAAEAAHHRHRLRRGDPLAQVGDVGGRGGDLGAGAQRREAWHLAMYLRLEHLGRNRDVRDAALAIGRGDRGADDAGGAFRASDRRGVAGDVAEQQVGAVLLQPVGPGIGLLDVAGDGEHRRMVLARLVQPGNEMGAARPGRPAAHAEPPGQLGLAGGGERGTLLVADADPFEAVAVADRVGERIERVADDAEHLGDADIGKGGNEQVGDGGHGWAPLVSAGNAPRRDPVRSKRAGTLFRRRAERFRRVKR